MVCLMTEFKRINLKNWQLIVCMIYLLSMTIILPYYPSLYRDEPWFSALAKEAFDCTKSQSTLLFNYSMKSPNWYTNIAFFGPLAASFNLFGFNLISGRALSLIFGFVTLLSLFMFLRKSGINRDISFLTVLAFGFTERFIWASHAIRPEIFSVALLSIAFLMVSECIRNEEKQISFEIATGIICCISLIVYDNTGMIIVFAFALANFFRIVFFSRKELWICRIKRLFSFYSGLTLFLLIWLFTNLILDPQFLSYKMQALDDNYIYYTQNVPEVFHPIIKIKGVLVIRSLVGFFIGHSWRPHILELIVLIPGIFFSLRRIFDHSADKMEKFCWVFIIFLLLGFGIAGHMPIYYWLLFYPPILYLLAVAFHIFINRNKKWPFYVGGFTWIVLTVFFQLAFSPFPVHNVEYSKTAKKINAIIQSDTFDSSIMGPIEFRYVFPKRSFTFIRDFGNMNNSINISLSEYCKKYGITYVFIRNEKTLNENQDIESNFKIIGKVSYNTQTGSILFPGNILEKSIHILKFTKN
jgi:hypothetical protein